jgi:hypothetical protein
MRWRKETDLSMSVDLANAEVRLAIGGAVELGPLGPVVDTVNCCIRTGLGVRMWGRDVGNWIVHRLLVRWPVRMVCRWRRMCTLVAENVA